MVEATDRPGVGNALAPLALPLGPGLVPMDVAEQGGLRAGAEQRPVVNSWSNPAIGAVLGHAAEDRAMRHRERRHAGGTGYAVDAGIALQQPGELLALGLGGRWRRPTATAALLIENAGERCPGARRHLCESRAFGREPRSAADASVADGSRDDPLPISAT